MTGNQSAMLAGGSIWEISVQNVPLPVSQSAPNDNRNMLYWNVPGETEMGSAGEQPIEG